MYSLKLFKEKGKTKDLDQFIVLAQKPSTGDVKTELTEER